MSDKFWLWVANRLQSKLVYWAAIRMGASATQDGNQVVPELLFFDALKRWPV